jgi:hypothetical protein
MAENGETRSPTSHRTPGQIVRHGRTYQARLQQRRNRAMRNSARKRAMKKGLVRKGDTKDVAHVRSLMRGGSNAESNTKIMSRSKNRGHGGR